LTLTPGWHGLCESWPAYCLSIGGRGLYNGVGPIRCLVLAPADESWALKSQYTDVTYLLTYLLSPQQAAVYRVDQKIKPAYFCNNFVYTASQFS